MVFSSPIFLFLFLPVMLLLVTFLPTRWKNVVLLVSSLFFYYWGERIFTFVMVLSIGWNYVSALMIDKAHDEIGRKWMLVLGITVNLLAIGYFKYGNFIIENLNELGLRIQLMKDIHLPIGISFFTFQSVSYLIDVYRKQTQANKDPIAVALYISLFPQLIAGPIVRYVDVKKEIEDRVVTVNLFALGIERFIVGLAKKIIIANTLAYVADQVFSLPESQLGTPLAWLGIICYTFQIYFDFSGYSDMAIGLGRMLGFKFLENFNYPYIARSIKDFWRRWHISLSTWFRDYLYIPLGGSRVKVNRIYLNLLIVFFLTGLWHGASWNFIVWGLFHGLFLVLERLGLEKLLKRCWRPLQHIYTILIVLIGWVFFRTESLTEAVILLEKLFVYENSSASESHLAMLINNEIWLILLLAVIFSTPFVAKICDWSKRITINNHSSILSICYDVVLFGIFFISCMYLAAGTYNPFIYYRF